MGGSATERYPTRAFESMRPIVLTFAGGIASGKSTLSTAVAKALGWPRVSFGDYVRTEARRRGLGKSREVLQNVGVSLIEGGWEPFCRAVLAQAVWQPGQSLVVDGVRHAEVVQELQRLVAPSKLLLVFIATSEPVRKNRLRERNMADYRKLQRIESHSTEAQVKTVLQGMVDLTVDGTQSTDILRQGIVAWVHQYTSEKC